MSWIARLNELNNAMDKQLNRIQLIGFLNYLREDMDVRGLTEFSFLRETLKVTAWVEVSLWSPNFDHYSQARL